MAARMDAAEALAMIMNDSDSGSELELSDNDEMYTPGNNSESSSSGSDAEGTIPLSTNGRQQARGRGSNRRGSNRRGRSVSRARGRGVSRDSRPGRHRQQNVPPEFVWRPVDIFDDFGDMDWLGTPRQKGVLIDTSDYKPVDYFKYYFPDDLFELMATNTNIYANQYLDAQNNLSRYSRFQKWTDTNAAELQAYVALQISMGLNNKPELSDYWGTYWLTKTRFSDVMSRNRYQLLTTFLHFSDNNVRVPRGEEGYDPLFKVRPIINIVDPKYMSAYAPDKQLAIDESMIKFKGRIFFRQYLPAKPTKWGIKTFVLSESNTGYGLKFMVYTGKNTFQVDTSSPLSVTEQVCLELVKGFENQGYELYMDNFYSSPKLYLALKDIGIGACGTVKHNRKFMPHDLQPNTSALGKGDSPVFMRTEHLITCAMMDTKRVHFLSSFHTDNTFDKRVRDRKEPSGHRVVERPVICEAYNQHMNGVDVLDQKLGTYAYPHKSGKWYMTIYHRIREVALVNAYIIYCKTSVRH